MLKAAKGANQGAQSAAQRLREWLLWRLFNQQVDEESEEEIVVQTTPGPLVREAESPAGQMRQLKALKLAEEIDTEELVAESASDHSGRPVLASPSALTMRRHIRKRISTASGEASTPKEDASIALDHTDTHSSDELWLPAQLDDRSFSHGPVQEKGPAASTLRYSAQVRETPKRPAVSIREWRLRHSDTLEDAAGALPGEVEFLKEALPSIEVEDLTTADASASSSMKPLMLPASLAMRERTRSRISLSSWEASTTPKEDAALDQTRMSKPKLAWSPTMSSAVRAWQSQTPAAAIAKMRSRALTDHTIFPASNH